MSKMHRVAVVIVTATIPDKWTAEDVADEIETLMELNGEDNPPLPLRVGVSDEYWRTV